MRRLVPALSLLPLCALPIHGFAQTADESPQALSDLTITGTTESPTGPVQGYKAERSSSATRTDTPLHETPQSVSVVSREALTDVSATSLQQALDLAGGVGRGNNFGGQGLTNYTVRGFTSAEYFRNGFPMNRGYPSAPDAALLERVEVLRGPAATLYGRSDPGGTFNVITKQPLGERKTTIGSQFTDQGQKRGTLDTTGPVDEDGRLAYRLNLIAQGGDTFRDDVHTERYEVAPVLSWQATDATLITFEADIIRNNAPLDRGRTNYLAQRAEASRSTNAWEKGTTNLLHNDSETYQLRFEHQLNDAWTLAGGFQYLDGSLKGNAVEANGVQANGVILGRNFSYRNLEWSDRDLQLNLTGHFDTFGLGHTLVTGVEVEDYDYRSIIQRSAGGTGVYTVNLVDPVLGQPRPALTRTPTHDHETLKSWAAFVQDQLAVTDRLKLLGGVRLERFEHDYDNFVAGGQSWSNDDTAVTPRLGASYDLTPELALYSSASKSFKPNTGAARQGGGFDPEEGKAYELGLKWAALGGRLSVDAAIFHTVKENVLTLDPVDPNFSVAAGEVRSRGFELNVAGDLTRNWRILGGYAYTDAEVTKDNSLPSGTRLTNIPRNAVNLLNVYEFHDGALRGLGLGGNIRYVGAREGQKTAVSDYKMDSYTVTDLLSFYQVDAHLRLNLDVRNVFNKGYDESSWNAYSYPGEPRTVQAGFTYTF
ncbi:TonB-dependent siderophore receptor [Pseudomonas oryzihabitans]|uniref:TonB-dependent siderophore receptor n=1 Tax=Pseudomonas oryzihabitans TaxID=47885 RepID=UPI00112224D6|nr:TonB-dependent siderophore receptor [Pseudomonas psychrotolerans]QDD89919.1 TonB-dependent siderophore receptor [Pseudomonas psychrotolerans]